MSPESPEVKREVKPGQFIGVGLVGEGTNEARLKPVFTTSDPETVTTENQKTSLQDQAEIKRSPRDVTGKGFHPGGRPKGDSLTATIRRHGYENVKTTDGQTLTRWEALSRRMWDLVLQKEGKLADRIKVAEWLADRGFGKALERIHQEIDLTGGAIIPKAIVSENGNGAIPEDVK